MITVRPPAPADAPVIAALAEQAGLFPADALEAMIAPFFAGEEGQHWLVASDGAEVVGIAYCAAELFTQGTYNLLAIGALPGREGQGIGQCLLAALEAKVPAVGGRLLLVETSSQAHFAPAQRFYHAAGFEHVATIPHYWAAGDDKIIFSKALAAES